MTGPASLVTRLAALVSASPVTVAVVAAGLAVGAVAGIMVTSPTTVPASGPRAPLDLVSCPDNGAAVARLDPGQRVLVIGRTADATWVAVHDPLPGRNVSWAPTAAMHFEGDPSTLPVMGCDTAAASFLAAATLTAVANNSPSPSPTPTVTSASTMTAEATASARPVVTTNPTTRPTTAPTTKPTSPPTVPPDTTKPTLTNPYQQYATIWVGSGCGATSTEIRVTATDASEIRSVSLLYRYTGTTRFRSKAMVLLGRSRYGTSLSTVTDGLGTGQIQYYFSATDKAGNTAVLYQSFFLAPNYFDLAVEPCIK
jgi:hypothetical protein